MKALIIYSTRGGVSRQCSEMLAEHLRSFCDVTLCDINNGAPTPDGYDVAVIGGSIHMNKLSKKLKTYIRENSDILNSISTAVFICCGYTDSFEDYVHFQIPQTLIPSLGIHFFGGELKPEKLHGLDKFIVKAVRSSIITSDFEWQKDEKSTLPEILPENIRLLADKIRQLL